MENQGINSKIKANAVSAYLLLFVSLSFLFIKENDSLNHPFVKSHVKTAFTIHLLFLFTYIIFISSWVLSGIMIFGLSLAELIAKTIFLILLTWLVVWIYRANQWKKLSSMELFHFAKSSPEKIIDINGDGKFWEKDKITLLLSYIPLVWFFNYAQYQKNNIIRNNTKLNLLITLIISFLSLFSHYNLATLLLLFYTIFIVFAGINMFTRNQIISLNLEKIPSVKELSYIIKSLWEYIKNYFSEEKFIGIHEIVNKKIDEDLKKEQQESALLEKKKDSRIPKLLVYIPYVNLIFLFIRNTKYMFHIRNGITITLLLILSQIIAYFWYYDSSFNQLVIIPILFWIWYSKKETIYKMAFIYEIYEWFQKLRNIVSFETKKVNQMRKKETEVSLKVK